VKKLLVLIALLLSQYKFCQAQAYTLAWSDSFTDAAINAKNWSFEDGIGNGGWGNNELQYYTNRPDNATVQNGNLHIIAKKEFYAGSYYTSARMISKGLQQFTYGKIEARIKLPQAQGLWPAFWMLGSNIDQVSWPASGELDIMEHVNTDPKIYGTMHWNNNGHVQAGASTNCNVTNYHVYGLEWTPDSLIWLLDGAVYFRNNIKNNINNTQAFQKPFFLILNLAVGGNWPGAPVTSTPFPDTMFVDYINVFQKFPLSIPKPLNASTISMYPNPAQEALHLVFNQNMTIPLKCFIYNTCGALVQINDIDNTALSQTIGINNLSSGLYYIAINHLNTNIYSNKFEKK
jgi:beta-glucanase (GH16 family)